MKHHAFMLVITYFHSMLWPVQAIVLAYNRHHGILFTQADLVVKPRNHLYKYSICAVQISSPSCPTTKTHDVSPQSSMTPEREYLPEHNVIYLQ